MTQKGMPYLRSGSLKGVLELPTVLQRNATVSLRWTTLDNMDAKKECVRKVG